MRSSATTRTLALLGALVGLLALPVASASAASPWWQILDGSRPSHLWEPTDHAQTIKTTLGTQFGGGLAVGIEVQGDVVGCLGTKNPVGTSFCNTKTGFPPSASAAELEALLEGVYGTSAVEVSGGPVGGQFQLAIADRGALPLKFKSLGLGSASSELIAEGGSGRLIATITNLGNGPVDGTETPVKIVDQLPEGLEATGAEAYAGVADKSGPVDCDLKAADLVECTFEGELPPYEAIEVEVQATAVGDPPAAGAAGEITISGGKAPTATAPQTATISPAPVPFGIERFSSQPEDEGGAPAAQAGSHPFQLNTTLQLNAGALTAGATSVGRRMQQPALARNLRFPLPAGLIGNATAMPQCSMADFLAGVEYVNFCRPQTAIGVISATVIETQLLGFIRLAVPVFNLTPAEGEPARFGFVVQGVRVVANTEVDPEDEYRIHAVARNITQLAQFLSSTTTLWGSPGDPRHDASRGWACTNRLVASPAVEEVIGECERPPGLPETPFLRSPVQCASPLLFGAEAEPWNVPVGSAISKASDLSDPLHGCSRVPFDPKISAGPTSKLAENPSGLSFRVTMPNSGLLSGEAIAEGQPKKVEVELPEGMTLNPSAAEGLAVCTPADYARERFDSAPGQGCPDASKLGNVEIDTPLIEENPKGSVYIAKSYENPFNSLLAIYIVARSPERGILVKLPVKISPNERTGQLIATLDDSPQTPFSSFDLSFREGGRAPLVTPPACGDYAIKARFVPWSAQDPNNPAPAEIVTRTSSFTVQRGVDGGACPPGGVPPFAPDFQAGSINNNAGSHTDFNMRLIREDGEQNMTRFSAVLPPGVLGKLAGIDKCPNSAIAKAKARTGPQGGHEEIADPSCPANSEIGRSLVGAGVGSVLTRVPGKVYLGGPFNGRPLSVIAITPVVAGPFDVGTVVVQEALTLNPKTAEVEVDGSASDPIPHILKGIPAKLRDLRVYVDRPNFIINPTSCDESSVKSTLFGSFLDVFSSGDDRPADLATRYQAANCANLGFKPNLKLNLKGGTRRGGHPGLKALYKPRRGDANVKGLVVRLPRSAFLDQAHIRTICTRVQFASDSCPKAAQYGYIKAWTPLLDEPLQGPVWLRSSNHKLPDLVFDLHGLVDVEVATRIDSARGGIRATVENAPDAPLSKVELRMQGGKKGLIINSRNLCGVKSRANVQFSGHNGKEASANPVMRAQCGGKEALRSARAREGPDGTRPRGHR